MPDIRHVCGAIDEIFARLHEASGAPAIAYGVVAGGEIVHSGGIGRVDDGHGGEAPPTIDSVFRIASLTKSFTAASVLILRDRGKLRLDAPIVDYVPALYWPDDFAPGEVPSVRDLLTMSGGLPTDDPWADRMESATDEEFDAMLRNGVRVIARPGTAFSYSNLGYAMLGRAIGGALVAPGSASLTAHARSREFVISELIGPLGMASTAFTAADLDQERLVRGFRLGRSGLVAQPWSSPGAFSPIGGLFSSLRDLSRWMTFLNGGWDGEGEPALTAGSRLEMQQAHRFNSIGVDAREAREAGVEPVSCARGYGFGVEVDHHPVHGRIVGHSGGYPGYGADMRWHPESGLGVVALANVTYAQPVRATRTALDLLLRDVAGARIDAPVAPEIAAIAQAADRLFLQSVHGAVDAVALGQLFAPNVDLDIPRTERLETWRALAADAGDVDGAPDIREVLRSDDAAHATWSRTCANGTLRFTIRLAPTVTPQIQRFDVTFKPRNR